MGFVSAWCFEFFCLFFLNIIFTLKTKEKNAQQPSLDSNKMATKEQSENSEEDNLDRNT